MIAVAPAETIPTLPSIYWYAVQTRPRAEYAALAEINGMPGLEAYLPQETRQRRTYKGKEPVHSPLMPGFIFVGSPVPPIMDAASPDHPHPIYAVLKSKSVRDLVRSPGGGAHPIRAQVIDGWRVNFVDYLRQREAAGDFDFIPRQNKATPAKPKTRSLKEKGDWKAQVAAAKQHLDEMWNQALVA